MKIKSATLKNAALDWAAAMAGNRSSGENRIIKICRQDENSPAWIERENGVNSGFFHRYNPGTDWAQCGDIKERRGISTIRVSSLYLRDASGAWGFVPRWGATTEEHSIQETTEHEQHDPMYQVYVDDVVYGPTELVAALRVHVISQLGKEIDVPVELFTPAELAKLQPAQPEVAVADAEDDSEGERPK